MVVLRCTQTLLSRLKRLDEDPGPSTTALGDWYGHLIRLGRHHILLFVSEKTRLPILMPVRDGDRIHHAFPAAVCEMLNALGIKSEAIERERVEMSTMGVGPTASRSLIGSLNDFGFLARARLIAGRAPSLLEMALELAETPVTPLGGKRPRVVTCKLLGASSV